MPYTIITKIPKNIHGKRLKTYYRIFGGLHPRWFERPRIHICCDTEQELADAMTEIYKGLKRAAQYYGMDVNTSGKD